jgi:pantetheine-phosphate adenylyltransferase
MSINRAVYSGSFDPPTNGHLWTIRQAAKIFSELIVIPGTNPDKRPMFSLDQRVAMIEKITETIPNVQVIKGTNQLLVNVAASLEAGAIVRSIRSNDDYGYERLMCEMNAKLQPDIQTIIFLPPPELCGISSQLVRGLIGFEGWEEAVKRLVPQEIFAVLQLKEADHVCV